MKHKLFFLFALGLSNLSFAQVSKLPLWVTNTVYIDPTNTGPESGSQLEPFKSTKSVGFAWKSKSAYLLKRNTTLKGTSTDYTQKDSIIIGAYGIGERPIISYNMADCGLSVRGTGCIVQDIQVEAIIDDRACGINMGTGAYGTINNCVVKGGASGIGCGDMKHLKILNTDVSGGLYDAMYLTGIDTITVFKCYLHDMILAEDRANQGSIDNMHTEGSKIIRIDSLYSDHSNFPGKYCLIINGADSVSVNNSTFIGHPKNGVVYPGDCKKGWTIKNCYFEGGRYALQNNTELRIYNSVFKGQKEFAIYEGWDKWIYNCTFIDQDFAIRNWTATVRELKNCIFYNYRCNLAGNGVEANFSNNCFYKCWDPSYVSLMGKDPILLDPEFVDYDNGNYRLKETSPCIDKAITIPTNTVDITGISRPQGTHADIGAYEYAPGTPSVFNVSTDGTGCANDKASVKLSGSETGVVYTLCKNNVKQQQTLEGTGNALDFGIQYQPGYYSVMAARKGINQTNKMKGSYSVLALPLPTPYYILGGGYYNKAIGGAPISLSNSQKLVNYQLLNNGSPIGKSVTGTGDSIGFGVQSKEGIYTIKATDSVTRCTNKMLNFVLISYVSQVNDIQKQFLAITPNPSSGHFVINFGKPNKKFDRLYVYNMSGTLVFEKPIEMGQTSVPIALNVATGEYIVKLKGYGTQYIAAKIIVSAK